jgi:hypothetical protein
LINRHHGYSIHSREQLTLLFNEMINGINTQCPWISHFRPTRNPVFLCEKQDFTTFVKIIYNRSMWH